MCNQTIQPQAPDRERGCVAGCRHPLTPRLVTQFRFQNQSAQSGGIGRQHKRTCFELDAGSQPNPEQLATHINPGDALGRTHLGPEALQITPKRRPEAGVVVVARYVEEQSLRGAKKVRVEHGDELTGREVVWMSEEAAREDLKCKVPSSRRKVKSIKEIRRALSVIAGVRGREVDVQQLQSSWHVHRSKIAKPKRWALHDERCDVQRRRARDPGEGVGVTVRRDQRVVRNSHQRLQVGIDPPEQRAKVVVLPEERMKAPAHRDLIIAVGHRPGTHPPTELIVGFDHDHRNAALSEPDRCRNTSNAAAGYDNRRGSLDEPCRTRRRRMTDCTSIPARPPPSVTSPNDHEMPDGLRARKVCRIPRCQPFAVRTSTSTNPARYRRSTKVWIESNDRTLRHR
jgi:hypothetical protein